MARERESISNLQLQRASRAFGKEIGSDLIAYSQQESLVSFLVLVASRI